MSGIFNYKKHAETKIMKKKEEKGSFLDLDMLAVPLVDGSVFYGYLVLRFAVELDNARANNSGVSDDVLLADQFYEATFNKGIFQPGKPQLPNGSEAADAILAGANNSGGSGHFRSLLLQQIDYFGRTEIRKKLVEERTLKE